MKFSKEKVEILMAERGYTQKALAKRSGLAQQTVSTALAKGTCAITTAGKLAKGLGVYVKEITE